MGICSSCCQNEDTRNGAETNERTHLLVDPVSNTNSSLHRVQRCCICQFSLIGDELMSGYRNLMPKKNDEQSALNKILHETATNVIDVSAMDSHDLEQHEYYERMKAYKARLNGLVRWSPPNQSKNLLNEVSVPEKILAADPISADNLLLVSNALEKTTEALSAVHVEHKEDLVVPFRIP